MTSYYLIALVVVLVALLFIQHRRNNSHLRRLSEALRTDDRTSLGEAAYRSAPPAFRELEKQIFEQLFEAETLEKGIGKAMGLGVRPDQALEAAAEALGSWAVALPGSDELLVRFDLDATRRGRLDELLREEERVAEGERDGDLEALDLPEFEQGLASRYTLVGLDLDLGQESAEGEDDAALDDLDAFFTEIDEMSDYDIEKMFAAGASE